MGQQAVAQLHAIPWGHNLAILAKCKQPDEALYYVRATQAHGWSRSVLVHQIESGLWQREGVAPAVTAAPGSVELAAALADEAALRDCWARWRGLGVEVIQPPTQMDFGLTMTAADPDGHRLRVFVPAM